MRKCTLLVICLVVAAVFASSPASAENSTNSANVEKKETRNLKKENLRMEKDAMKNDVMNIKKASREAMMENKAAMKEQISARRAQFKEDLQNIQDTNKQAVVDKIDTRIASMNTTQTQKWTEDLSKLNMILDRISTEAATLQNPAGANSPLDQAVTAAETALTTAETAVATQAAKEYVINITSESALRGNVGTTIAQFRADLRTTRQKMIAARQAVSKAAMELKKAKNGTIENNASNAAGLN